MPGPFRAILTFCLRPPTARAGRIAAVPESVTSRVLPGTLGHNVVYGTCGKAGPPMTGQLDTINTTSRRADYDAVWLGRRDIDGLLLCAEHFGAPYDLLAAALGAQPARLRGITAGPGGAAPGTPPPGGSDPAWPGAG